MPVQSFYNNENVAVLHLQHLCASMRSLFTPCDSVIWSQVVTLERNFIPDRGVVLSTCFLIIIQLLQNYKYNLRYLRQDLDMVCYRPLVSFMHGFVFKVMTNKLWKSVLYVLAKHTKSLIVVFIYRRHDQSYREIVLKDRHDRNVPIYSFRNVFIL